MKNKEKENRNKITTDFEKFKDEQGKKFNKEKEYEPLVDDITILQKLENGEYEKVKGPIQVRQITGVIMDDKEINKIENQLSEGVPAAPVFNTDLQLKKVKRGDIIWVTALLERPGPASWNAQTMGVIKARIVDYYYGLNKLKYIK
jgi:hypothetical protein